MKSITKKLSVLKRPEKNTRLHTDKQLAEFRRSVEMFGQIRPIVCDENGVILAGNGLYETLLSMGRTEAECYVVDGLTENEKKKLMLADNRIFDLGVDDMKIFDEFIAELGDDLDVPGFDDDLLRAIVSDAEKVDEMMSSYGLITEEKKEQLTNAAENYKAEAENRIMEQNSATPETAQATSSEEQPERKFVICTKCGEQIWL